MQNSPLEIKRSRFLKDYSSVQLHLKRMLVAKSHLSEKYPFPWTADTVAKIKSDEIDLAYADQFIYRFSKLQDTIGGKLVKSFMEMQGESSDQPFLDLLNALERIEILKTETWFELRKLRNSIAHEYANEEDRNPSLFNRMDQLQEEIISIVVSFGRLGKA